MRNNYLLSILAVLAIMQMPAAAIDGKHINGRAVSVQWRSGHQSWGSPPGVCEGGSEMWKGSIDLFTIANGVVVRTDTLWSRSKGFAYYPAFNITGTHVAFYRYGSAPGAGTSCVSVNSGRNTIAVIGIDGNNLVDLCEIPSSMDFAADSWGGLDWPVGDWIYYTCPNASTDWNKTGSVDIWKVNCRTKENLRVCKLTDNTGTNLQCHYLRRFQLNLTGTKMGIQGPFPEYECNETPWTLNGICNFPPPNGNIQAASGQGLPGCNAAISASGDLSNNYIGSSHGTLYITNFRTGANEMQLPSSSLCQWFGGIFGEVSPGLWSCDLFGGDGEGVRWAVNSDKWVLQQLGWYGHASEISWGSNQVAGNWVDQAAIRISNNSKVPKETCPVNGIPGPDCCGGCGKIYYGNEAGDLWIDGGANNLGKYEDETGVWHAVPGYIPTGMAQAPPSAISLNQLTASIQADGSVLIDVPASLRTIVRITDIQGKCRYSSVTSGTVALPAGTLAPGVYFVGCQSGPAITVTKF